MPKKVKTVKPLAEMRASEINRELDKIERRSANNTDAFLVAGRGHERPSEYLKKTDPLSLEALAIFEQRSAIRAEMERRYGPNCPSRLPRGFGPIRL
jgi:hypothetical protein